MRNLTTGRTPYSVLGVLWRWRGDMLRVLSRSASTARMRLTVCCVSRHVSCGVRSSASMTASSAGTCSMCYRIARSTVGADVRLPAAEPLEEAEHSEMSGYEEAAIAA